MYNPFQFNQKDKRSLQLNNTAPFIIAGGKIISNNLTVSAEEALKHSDIYGVVNRISSDIASASIDIQKPFHKVIENPNKRQTKFGFFQSVLASMLLTGNAFVTIHRDGSLVPDELELVPSSNVQMLLTDDLDILYTFSYNDGRPNKTLESKDVLHFKLMSTGYEDSLYTGRSPLESLVNEVAIQDNSNRLTLNTLQNAISPTNILKVEKGILDSEHKKNLKQAFENSMRTGSTVVLDQSADLKTVQINSDVANFLKNNTYTSNQVAVAFGVPASYVGLNADEQSSIDMIRSQYISCLNTYIKPIEQELSKKLSYNNILDVKVNILDAIDTDNQALIKNVVDLSNAKAISPEQAQTILANYKALGMDKVIKDTGLQNTDTTEKVVEQ